MTDYLDYRNDYDPALKDSLPELDEYDDDWLADDDWTDYLEDDDYIEYYDDDYDYMEGEDDDY